MCGMARAMIRARWLAIKRWCGQGRGKQKKAQAPRSLHLRAGHPIPLRSLRSPLASSHRVYSVSLCFSVLEKKNGEWRLPLACSRDRRHLLCALYCTVIIHDQRGGGASKPTLYVTDNGDARRQGKCLNPTEAPAPRHRSPGLVARSSGCAQLKQTSHVHFRRERPLSTRTTSCISLIAVTNTRKH